MVKITGRQAFKARLKGIASEDTIKNVGAALYAAGDEIRTEAAHMITEGAVSGSGHEASKPGEAPKNDTGTLIAHIETIQVAPLKVEVSSNAPYAAIQEFGGTIHHPGGTPYFMRDGMAMFVSKSGQGAYHTLPVTKPHDIVLLPRPYMQPATDRKRKEVINLVREAVNKAVKG